MSKNNPKLREKQDSKLLDVGDKINPKNNGNLQVYSIHLFWEYKQYFVTLWSQFSYYKPYIECSTSAHSSAKRIHNAIVNFRFHNNIEILAINSLYKR